MQVNSKVYYNNQNGEVLIITSECTGGVLKQTLEKDIQTYEVLQSIDVANISFIELEYGTLANTFSNAKSYYVDTENKKLVIDYYTQEELEDMQKQQEEQFEKEQLKFERANAIAEYLQNSDIDTIEKIEDSVLNIETDKILNEMR